MLINYIFVLQEKKKQNRPPQAQSQAEHAASDSDSTAPVPEPPTAPENKVDVPKREIADGESAVGQSKEVPMKTEPNGVAS